MVSRLRVGVPVLAAVLLAGGWLLGQTKPADDSTPTPTKLRGVLPPNFKKLGLTDEQTRHIYRIRGTYGAKIDVLVQQIRDLRAEEMGEIEKILTDAQKARLKELKLGDTGKAKDSDKKADTDKKSDTDKKADTDKKGNTDKK
jgi:hypothetical protein